MKKNIIIPEFVPLYAMRKVFGPQTGPIRTPIAVDTAIIEELLGQRPPVKVFEVKLTNAKTGAFSDKIELTKDNFDKNNWEVKTSEPVKKEEKAERPVAEVPQMATEEAIETAPVEEPTMVATETISEPVEEVKEEAVAGAAESNETDNNAPKLTKAQRRAIERAKQGTAKS